VTEPMTTTASTLVQQLSASEPDWLRNQREVAWERYSALPSPRLEKSDLTKRGWEFGPFPEKVSHPQAEDTRELVASLKDVPAIIVRDGLLDSVSSLDELESQGIIFTDLATAIRLHGDLVEKHLGTVVQTMDAKWTALNSSVWRGGVFLYVPRHVKVEQPFHFIYEESASGKGAFPRALIIAEEDSEVAYVETYITNGERPSGHVHSAVLEVVAKADAKVTVVSLTQFRKGPTNYSVRKALLGKNAKVDWIVGDIGDGFTVATVENLLKGNGSLATTKYLGIGGGRQHMDLTTSMVHSGRYSLSDIVMNGVLLEKAVSIFRSATQIIRGAGGASSEQYDRILMLSDSSRADAIPMLLIDENDVQRCGHAASVGRIDQKQVYYLMSRGIPELTATKMIVWGYLHPTVDAIPSVSVRDWMIRCIDRELAK